MNKNFKEKKKLLLPDALYIFLLIFASYIKKGELTKFKFGRSGSWQKQPAPQNLLWLTG